MPTQQLCSYIMVFVDEMMIILLFFLNLFYLNSQIALIW